MNVYPFIEAEKAQQHSVKRACELLKVSRAAYYATRDGQPCDRDRQDAELTARIKAEHKRSRGRYGAPRIHAELCRQGRRHSRKQVARLMRQAGLAAAVTEHVKLGVIRVAVQVDTLPVRVPAHTVGPTPPLATRSRRAEPCSARRLR